MKLKVIPFLAVPIIMILVLPSLLPSAVALKSASFTPNYIKFATPNPSFENEMKGWSTRLKGKDKITGVNQAYTGKRCIKFIFLNRSEIFLGEPTEYLPLNDTLVLSFAVKGLKPIEEGSAYLEVDTLVFWSWKKIIPIHVIIGLNESSDFTRVELDKSGIYLFRGYNASDSWVEYRLRLGSPTIRKLLAEFLIKYENETLASPEDEYLVRFLYLRPRNLEGYLDNVGIGYLTPSLVTLNFDSLSLIPMSFFVSSVSSNGQHRSFEVSGSYSFSITFVEPLLIPSSGLFNVTVAFSTGQVIKAEIKVAQEGIIWI